MGLRRVLAALAVVAAFGVASGCGGAAQSGEDSADEGWSDRLSAERQAFAAADDGGWFAGCDVAVGVLAESRGEPPPVSGFDCEMGPGEPLEVPSQPPDDIEGAGYELGFVDGCEAVRREYLGEIDECQTD